MLTRAHSAVIYRNPDSQRVYIFESENGMTFDEGVNPNDGVLLAPLRWLYSSKYGRDPEAMIGIRKLSNFERTPEDIAKAEKFICANLAKPYEGSMAQMGTAICDGNCYVLCCWTPASCIAREEAAKTMFCSEAVSGMLQELGPLSDAYPSSHFSPGDLGETTGLWLCCPCQINTLPMARGARYDADVVLKNPALTGVNFDEYYPEHVDSFIEEEIALTRKDIESIRVKHGFVNQGESVQVPVLQGAAPGQQVGVRGCC